MSKTKELLAARAVEIEAEIAKIEEASAPLRAERDALQEQVLPVEARMRDLQKAIRDLEQPALSDLKTEIATIAKALGGKSMKAESGAVKVGE